MSDYDIPDPPEAPCHFGPEAAYGWVCGWTSGYEAALEPLPAPAPDAREALGKACEALAPFARVAIALRDADQDHEILVSIATYDITVGDLRRAREAYYNALARIGGGDG